MRTAVLAATAAAVVLVMSMCLNLGASRGSAYGAVADGSNPRAIVDRSAPSVPQGLTMTANTQTSISLDWDASRDNVGVAGYRLYKDGVAVATTSSTAYTFSGLACGTRYTLAVEAYDAAGNASSRGEATTSRSTSACASADTQAPSVPQGLTMTANTQSSVSLNWTASSDNVGVAGYRLYKDGAVAGTTSSTAYTFSGLACGTNYTLAVEAYDAAGNASNRGEATTWRSTSACTEPTPTPTPSPTPTPTPSPTPTPPPSGTASVFVSPGGSDANGCSQSAPCASFNRAYRAARPGEAVEVAAGTYPAQTIVADTSKTSPERVLLRPAAGAAVVLRGLRLGTASGDGPRNLVIRDMRVRHADGRDAGVQGFAGTNNVLWENLDAANFYLNGVKNFTVRGGDWGPCTSSDSASDGCSNSKIDGNSAPYGNENVLIDGAYFHDYRIVLGSGAHFECMFLNGGRNITVRNSRFEDCAFYDIFVARRSGDAFDGLTIENNWLDTPWNEAPAGPTQTRPGAIEFSHGGDLSEPWKNVLVRFNSFHASTGINWNGDGTAYSTTNNRAIGNIMRNNTCDSRFLTAYNLVNGTTCSATDRNIGSAFPYSNPAHLQQGGNWHLTSTTAIDTVPTNHPDTTTLADDIDNTARPRGNGRDAGADEAG